MVSSTSEDGISALFEPSSLAIVGASADPTKWGNTLCRRLLSTGYRRRFYPINPTALKILGHKAYPSVLDVPGEVDQAVVITKVSTVPRVVDECVAKRVKVICVITSGFGEVGEKGRLQQEEIVRKVRAAGLRVVGPNCMGVFSLPAKLNTTNCAEIPAGHIAVVAQSGNVAGSLIIRALQNPDESFGFSHIVTLGNQADVEFHDCLRYLREDPKIKLIILYVEEIKNGRVFVEEARKTTRTKPIIALKAGSTSAGSRAAFSHTGSMAGDDQLYDAAFERCGIVRVENFSDLLPTAEALLRCPPIAGKRIVILTDGGGHGALTADAAESYGLELPMLPESVQREFEPLIAMGSAKNPIDMDGADWSAVTVPIAEGCLKRRSIDGLVIAGGLGWFSGWYGRDMSKIENEMAHSIGRLVKQCGKPIILQSDYANQQFEALRILRRAGVPVYESPSMAAYCLWTLAEYHRLRTAGRLPKITPNTDSETARIISRHKGKHRVLLDTEVMRVLDEYEILTPRHALATNPEDAKIIGRKIGFPLAMKVVCPEISHKSEAGCVKLNVGSSEVESVYEQILHNARAYNARADVKGIMVYEMMPKGVEMAVGTVRRSPFGSFLMVGVGGVFIEALRDVQFAMIPTSSREVREKLERLKAYPLLKGFRGVKPVNIDAVTTLAERVSRLAAENPDISQIDLNPVLAYDDRAVAADARMMLGNA